MLRRVTVSMNSFSRPEGSCPRFSLTLSIAVGCVALLPIASASEPGRVDFDLEIRPILSDHCFQCHGPDEQQREADLRLDVAEQVFADRGEYSVVVAGNRDQSELYRRITSTDEDERMPPVGTKHKLTRQQIERLGQWIEQGAPWKDHWAFVPPTSPPIRCWA